MAFIEAVILVGDTPEGADLIHEYAKLVQIHKEKGEDHGYSMVCQLFAHKNNPRQFFLSGRLIDPEKTKAIAAILKSK